MPKSPAQFAALFAAAQSAGEAAADACTPVPMIVNQHANVFDDASPVTKSYFVPDGVCGFASVQIRPATSSFARWLRKNGYARLDSYYGGLSISIMAYNQSLQKKEAHAGAMAKVFAAAGYNAHVSSRMD